MSEVTLDLATKIIRPDTKIWVVFPGLGKRFYPTFSKRDVVFLDMPRLGLTEGILNDDILLRKNVAMSIAWHKYYSGESQKIPSRIAAQYNVPKGRSFGAEVGNVVNLFIKAKPGDIVLVGGQSSYDPILIGEIAGPVDPKFSIRWEDYGGSSLPARRVYWLRKDFERRYLSLPLSTALSNKKAVTQIDADRFGEEIFPVAFGDYISDTESRYRFRGPKYKNIATSTVPGIDLISYFAAAFHAADEGELEEFARLDIPAATQNYFEQDILYSFELQFGSAGSYVLDAKRAALPLVVALLVSATSSSISLPQARAAEIKNSADLTTRQKDSCSVEIKEKYRAIMNAINADRYNEMCALNKDAQHGVGLKVGVKQTVREKQ